MISAVTDDEQSGYSNDTKVVTEERSEGAHVDSVLAGDCNISRIVVKDWTEEVENHVVVCESTSIIDSSHEEIPIAPKHIVALDRNLGFSTVHVYHEEGGSNIASCDGRSDDPDSQAPFLSGLQREE